MLARKQTLFNYHSTLPLAETASVFGEMMVFDRLARREPDPRARLGLVAGKIEDGFATVYRQCVLTRFEQAAFEARTQARLTPERLGDAWIEANGRYYGDSVQLTDGYRWGWSYIPHFIHSRFYCYAYVFGELLALALFRLYQEEGPGFVPKFVRLLEQGGSTSPEELLAPLDVDFRDAGFWQKGFDEFRRLVDWAKELAAQI
jgi:oligoendopeptidase F